MAERVASVRVGGDFNMRPVIALNHAVDCSSVYSVESSEPSHIAVFPRIAFSDVVNSSFVKNSIRMVFAKMHGRLSASIASIFSNAIKLIVSVRSHKQMGWTHTCRIIALMADDKTIWNLAVFHRPRQSMSFPSKALKANSAITRPISKRNPVPARFSFFDFIPESFHNRDVAQTFGVV